MADYEDGGGGGTVQRQQPPAWTRPRQQPPAWTRPKKRNLEDVTMPKPALKPPAWASTMGARGNGIPSWFARWMQPAQPIQQPRPYQPAPTFPTWIGALQQALGAANPWNAIAAQGMSRTGQPTAPWAKKLDQLPRPYDPWAGRSDLQIIMGWDQPLDQSGRLIPPRTPQFSAGGTTIAGGYHGRRLQPYDQTVFWGRGGIPGWSSPSTTGGMPYPVLRTLPPPTNQSSGGGGYGYGYGRRRGNYTPPPIYGQVGRGGFNNPYARGQGRVNWNIG